MYLLALVGLAFSFAVPALAQEQNAVDPEVRRQIEDAYKQRVDAYNKQDAARSKSSRPSYLRQQNGNSK
jgi:hypothetical protein